MAPRFARSPTASDKPAFDWDGLAIYKADGSFLPGYPSDVRTFYSPVDDLHGVLTALLRSARKSIVINMYGYDDDELNDIILSKLRDEQVYVQMSLDKSQAGGVHERELLKQWDNDGVANSIAIGHSTAGAISHLKMVIVDGIYTVRGSTNWSLSGEQKQDNELTLHNNAVLAAETRAELDRNHDAMLKQMAAARAATRAGAGAGRLTLSGARPWRGTSPGRPRAGRPRRRASRPPRPGRC